MVITSNSNEKIKYINSLKEKKNRDKYGKFILEGIKLVDEYMSSVDNSPEFIVISSEILLKNSGGDKIYEKIKEYENLIEVNEKIFSKLSETKTPQGILIVINKKKDSICDVINSLKNNERALILDKISDAGNLGTIIRCAVCFGIKNIICTKGTADVYSSKVVRSTMGAIYKLNIIYMDYAELENLKNEVSKMNYIFVGTDLKAKEYINEVNPINKMIYVMGNEANGISDEIKKLCDLYVKIPIENSQESLNVAIASAIFMYDMYVRGD